MSRRACAVGLALIAFAGAQPAIVQDPRGACSTIATNFEYENAQVYFSEHISAGTNLSLPSDTAELQSCGNARGQVVPVDLCRISLYVATSDRSGINVEAWLPTNWTGRFLATGNGGLAGCIGYRDMAYGTEFGFAAVGANNGHNGTSGESFYQNPDVVQDFAWRSLYTETLVGKAITDAFYGQAHTKSYYLGCSTGGRQGFKMAQDYPDLFDGIVAGAPALAFNNLSSWSGRFFPITGSNTSATFIEPEKWALIHADILAQCDSLDGVEDGIIEDPNLCQYKPITLQCPSNATNTSTCLTGLQVQTVTDILSPYHGTNGALIYPRLQPGAELLARNIYLSGQPFQYTSDWFRYAILNDPTWDPATLNSTYASLAATLNPFDIETWSGDLRPFQSSGGKLLHWHGLMDAIISSDNSARYYEHVVSTMNASPVDLDAFYRYFRVSGAGHCSGGDGAWQIGNTAGGSVAAEYNILQRIVDWVELGDGAAPETLTGVRYVNDTVGLGVELERRHCKWPKRNRCVDPENYLKPEAWECVV